MRIIRACRDLGLETVAVYSDADSNAAHVRLADRAVRIGPPPAAESYLRIDAILDAAKQAAAEAVHPGYGFLAERGAFARQVVDAGLVFVGPSAETIDALGDKLHARRLATSVGVPVVPGTLDPVLAHEPEQLAALDLEAEGIGFPLLVKAAAGGGGRGMRRVGRREDLAVALLEGSREASDSFGDGRVYLEREVVPARHIEVQLLGDHAGQVVALGERDCSLQRRHQKLIEEAPAPGLTEEERRWLHGMAVQLGVAAGLANAATCEFLRAPDGAFFFLEVNTRLQVEHGVTELVGNVDMVREQLLIAADRPLSPEVIAAASRAARPDGHAIEVRISAEDPGRDFAPAPGPIRHWVMPSGPGVRVDAAIEAGDRVPPEYDNLIAKVMVHDTDRGAALRRLRRALDETEIAGVQTTLPFHRFVARHAGFAGGDLSTGWVAEHWDGPAAAARIAGPARVAAALAVMHGLTVTMQEGNPPEPAHGSETVPAVRRTEPAEMSGAIERGLPGASRLGTPRLGGGEGDRAVPGAAGGRPAGGWAEAALEAAVDRWPR